MTEPVQKLQLEGAELDQAHSHATAAQEELLSLAKLVLEKISPDTSVASVAEIRVRPNNEKVSYYDGNGGCLAVYEDPPGLCRPCIPQVDYM